MIDNKTPHLSLPLPHADNLLTDDVSRLRAALDLLDTHAAQADANTGQTAADLADVRTVAESAAKTALWPDIAGKPESFPPAPHGHTFADLSGIPSDFPPAAHEHDATYAAKAHTHPASDLGIPSQFFRGFIAPFYGSLGGAGNKFPLINGVAQTSWHVCDGTDGTPDMRDRVAVGASGSKPMGGTGGNATANVSGAVAVNSESVSVTGNIGATTLTVAQMPSHSHSGAGGKVNVVPSGSWSAPDASGSTGVAGGSTSHTHADRFRQFAQPLCQF